MTLVNTDSNMMETKLATFKNAKFYKIPPPEVIPDTMFAIGENPAKGYKEIQIIRYQFKPENWRLKRSNYLFRGSIELHELQSFDALDSSKSLSAELKCRLTINAPGVENWGKAYYEKLYHEGLLVTNYKQHSPFMTIQKIIHQHYVLILTEGDKRIAVGMILQDFFDDLRLTSNLKDFEERFRKLLAFKDNFVSDSPTTAKEDPSKGSPNRFNIDDDDEFGDFVAG
ncbi:hypothetical protein OGAPHI_000407 [Ogataea philodendri]|uniref:Uncharacterized protein n=1 Tax=Ogataea philodendri TaxID=1378263 RepID=A0A9P8PGN3_9ASCO|nr:uncharacterized protein OGAPHI_000407 [Ogataea philodendri]KAH3671702.1 hypothetical protein OGAPHI_000407 [Ogataea philodendri]